MFIKKPEQRLAVAAFFRVLAFVKNNVQNVFDALSFLYAGVVNALP